MCGLITEEEVSVREEKMGAKRPNVVDTIISPLATVTSGRTSRVPQALNISH
jgi:hypothetical protein